MQTPHRPVELLSSGEYVRSGTYRTWRPAGTDDWLLILTVEGEGVAASGDHTTVMKCRSVVLFRPNTPQEYRSAQIAHQSRWHFLWAHFRPSADHLAWLAWPELSSGFCHIPELPRKTYDTAVVALRDANAHLQIPQPDQEALAMNALERAILHIGAYSRATRTTVDPRLQRVAQFITRNLHRSLSLRDLAEAASMSPSHFCHIFPAQMGKSPQAFVEESRMRWAAMRLRLEDASISEIAYGLGYSNPFYFSNRFRKHHGISPTMYRRKMRPES